VPAALKHPGVYIEEIPSGVRTITGVATSITAFVGRAKQGPVNVATRISSFAEYERAFGGLMADSMMSYSVRDFFLNGGGAAVIVRVHRNATPSIWNIPTGGAGANANLIVHAANPGAWSASLRLSANGNTSNPADTTLFNLVVTDAAGNLLEQHLNLSITPTAIRYWKKVLPQASTLITFDPGQGANAPNVRPNNLPLAPMAPTTAGTDGADITDAEVRGSPSLKTGIYALDDTDLFNLMVLPPLSRTADTTPATWQDAIAYCVKRRAFLIVDSPRAWTATPTSAVTQATTNLSTLNISGTNARNAAIFFPNLRQVDPLNDNRVETFAPGGAMAGIMARTDAQRGVWKAPAGLDAAVNGIVGFDVNFTDDESGILNPLGINALRNMGNLGRVVWGSRTMRGNDVFGDEYKYIPVRRLALFLEETLFRSTQWAVFEPNDEPLWSQLRLNIGAFMQGLFRQGAFQGSSPRDAYFVKCDAETTTQADINLGVVNIVVGFAPLKPAEFVVIKFQQIAGKLAA